MQIAKDMELEYQFYDEDHHSKIMQLADVARGFKPDILAVSFMTPQYYEAAKTIRKVKQILPTVSIIIGGPHPTSLPEMTMRDLQDVDFLCKGEGEKTFGQFLAYLKGDLDYRLVDGMYYRQNNQIASNSPRTLMSSAELNKLKIDWQKLMKHGPYMQKLSYRDIVLPVYPVLTARGCPYECTFCDEGNIWKRKLRERSVENVINEIKYLVDNFNAEYVCILDDTFTVKKKRVLTMCNEFKKLNIRFRITARVTDVDKEILAALAEAGCDMVAYGVESGDNKVLAKMKKRQTVDDIINAFLLTKEANILSYALCMVGNIGEDMKAVRETARLIRDIKPDQASCTIMQPYPGSENYRICKHNGWIRHHEWEKWVPSVLKTKNFKVVSVTDKMTENEIEKAFYVMNRMILNIRFKQKYGKYFFLKHKYYQNEIIPRIKTVGILEFVKHAVKMLNRLKMA